MDPVEFLHLADSLSKNTSDPAKLRSATSRAYYAAHHFGKKMLTGMKFKIPFGHQAVWNRLQNCGDPDVEAVGSQLVDLHSSRIRADYRLDFSEAEKVLNVGLHLKQAEKIINQLTASCLGNNRSKIIETIRKWEQATNQVTHTP
jgi:uncharacterized protein (UPF0332 family)